MPTIDSIDPASGPEQGGTVVTIRGSGFAPDGQRLASVRFGPTPAVTCNVDSDVQIIALTPAGTGDVNVVVGTLFGGQSVSSDKTLFRFDKVAAGTPSITGVSPAAGPIAGGIDLDIAGSGLSSANVVDIGPMVVTTPFVVDDTHIIVTLPALAADFGPGGVHITVQTASGISAATVADEFEYLAPPIVTSLSAQSGVEGDVITLYGQNLAHVSDVWFDDVQGFGVWANGDGEVSVFVPAGVEGAAVDVIAQTPGGYSEANESARFVYGGSGLPVVTGVDPSAGTLEEARVSLLGSGLAAINAVWFGGIAVEKENIEILDDAQLLVTAPAVAGEAEADIIVQSENGFFSLRNDNAVYTYYTEENYAAWVAAGGSSGGAGAASTKTRILTITILPRFTIDHKDTLRSVGPPVKDGTTVEIRHIDDTDTNLSSVTTRNGTSGVAKIDISSLVDGSYKLLISAASIGRQSLVEAGPALDPGDVDVCYRDLEVGFILEDGTVAPDTTTERKTGVAGEVVWGDGFRTGPLSISVDWKPDWYKFDFHSPRPSGIGIDFIMIHCTDGLVPDIENFKKGYGKEVSAHYLIDVDGHVVKMVSDKEFANHAGQSWYDGVASLNPSSIGIEHVTKSGPYRFEQMQASLKLVQALVGEFNVPARHLLGHVDAAVSKSDAPPLNLLLGGRGLDPGPLYDWPLLEQAGLATSGATNPAINGDTIYEGYFAASSDPADRRVLQVGDSDATSRYGGKSRTGTPLEGIDIIKELQADLSEIGYAISTDDTGTASHGAYDLQLSRAVSRFQLRFFSGGRKRTATPSVEGASCDRDTAIMIKTVLAAL